MASISRPVGHVHKVIWFYGEREFLRRHGCLYGQLATADPLFPNAGYLPMFMRATNWTSHIGAHRSVLAAPKRGCFLRGGA